MADGTNDPTTHQHLPLQPATTTVPTASGPTVGDGTKPEARFDPCYLRQVGANASLATRDQHWWQNWGKTHGYVCERMFFPTTVDELAAAVHQSEANHRPVRAVGGGWSFSECALPGTVAMARPCALGIEAITRLVPASEAFSTDPLDPVIAQIAQENAIPNDQPAMLIMLNAQGQHDERFRYVGNGGFEGPSPTMQAYQSGFRPVTSAWLTHGSSADVAGTLAMADIHNARFSAPFYNGNGLWSNPLNADGAVTSLQDLVAQFAGLPRPSTPAYMLGLLTGGPKPAYLINTQSMASSLQQHLPDLLSAEALRATSEGTPGAPNPSPKHYFHVEAGITMDALSELLQRQSPRLAIRASGGSPGATLAGALATGTHGGEFKWDLLVDCVRAVHLVGPGGKQWWIEGSTSVADPEKLLATYPCLERNRIITGTAPIEGLVPDDWLHAVVVSMGSMGVIYSMVLDVVPLFGIHEVVVQLTWQELLARAQLKKRPITTATLRSNMSAAERTAVGRAILRVLEDGAVNGSGISASENQYVDLAFDPNACNLTLQPHPTWPTWGTPPDLTNADWTCWVMNRAQTARVPFEPNPAPKGMMSRIAASLKDAVSSTDIAVMLERIFNVDFIQRLADQCVPVDAIIRLINQISAHKATFTRLFGASDLLDAALEELAKPLEHERDLFATHTIVSAVFAGLMGIDRGRAESTDAVTSTGSIGFPASGIMGTGIEIAMGPDDAFPFIQTEILDHMTRPFLGYVSVRLCPPTRALLGMPQFAPKSVMVEVVAFGTDYARTFVHDLQKRTVDRIRGGFNAMLHWGLENDLLDAAALRAIPALNQPGASKLEKFRTVRQRIYAAGGTTEHAFDNAFTQRLGL